LRPKSDSDSPNSNGANSEQIRVPSDSDISSKSSKSHEDDKPKRGKTVKSSIKNCKMESTTFTTPKKIKVKNKKQKEAYQQNRTSSLNVDQERVEFLKNIKPDEVYAHNKVEKFDMIIDGDEDIEDNPYEQQEPELIKASTQKPETVKIGHPSSDKKIQQSVSAKPQIFDDKRYRSLTREISKPAKYDKKFTLLNEWADKFHVEPKISTEDWHTNEDGKKYFVISHEGISDSTEDDASNNKKDGAGKSKFKNKCDRHARKTVKDDFDYNWDDEEDDESSSQDSGYGKTKVNYTVQRNLNIERVKGIQKVENKNIHSKNLIATGA